MNLFWKEFRESVAPVSLALGVICVIALWPMLQGRPHTYGLVWGIGFHESALAILIFVALVLGVMAYAVEEEQETITPLLAMPVPANDIMAAKIAVRLGLLLVACVLIGIIELFTRAWPIEWGIPRPQEFLRWLGLIAHMVLGFGLGLYFGKKRGSQTAAFLISVVIIMVGVALLNLTPIRFLFEDAEGLSRWAWVRGILVTGGAGTAAILLAIFGRRERPRLLPAGAGVALGLAFYGLIAWSVTVIPINETWMNPRAYWDYWTIRFGPAQDAAEVIARRGRPFRQDQDENLDLLGWVISRTGVTPPGAQSRYNYDYRATSFIGAYPQPPIQPERTLITRYTGLSDSERFFLAHADDQRYREMAAAAEDVDLPVYPRMIALHAASYGPADLNEVFARLLADPSQDVRAMAALLLVDRGDPRGADALRRMVPTARPFIQREIVDLSWQYDLDLDRDLGPVMRGWLEERAENPIPRNTGVTSPFHIMGTRERYQTALRWIDRYGQRSDLNLIRRARWASLMPARRDTTSLQEIDVENYLRDWGDPGYPGILRQRFRESLDYLLPRLDRLVELSRIYASFSRTSARNLWVRTSREGYAYTSLSQRRSEVTASLRELARLGSPDLVELWRQALPVYRTYSPIYYRSDAELLLPLLADHGQDGLLELEHLFEDPSAPPTQRVQAGLLLMRHGRTDLTQRVLRLWELYRGSGGYTGYVLGSRAREAILILLWEGNAALAGVVIDNANRGYAEGRASSWPYSEFYYSYLMNAYMGTPYWNTGLVEVLKHATGQDFGWDLKAWTKWWERERDRLAAGN